MEKDPDNKRKLKHNFLQEEGPSTPLLIDPKKVTRLLAAFALLLIVLDVSRLLIKNQFPTQIDLIERLEVFQFTHEFNLPTLFSSFILFFSGVLLLLISASTPLKQYRKHWAFLGFVFFFLSLDESLKIHEGISWLIRENFTVEGSIKYGTWVIPYLILSIILGLTYIRFILHLPTSTKFLVVTAGFIYVSSAAGFELLEGYFYMTKGEESLPYRSVHWLQEALEMLGILVFIHGLLGYLERIKTNIAFSKV